MSMSEAMMLNAATTMMKKSNTAITSFCMDSAAKRLRLSVFQSITRASGPSRRFDFGLDAHSLHRVGKAQFHPEDGLARVAHAARVLQVDEGEARVVFVKSQRRDADHAEGVGAGGRVDTPGKGHQDLQAFAHAAVQAVGQLAAQNNPTTGSAAGSGTGCASRSGPAVPGQPEIRPP